MISSWTTFWLVGGEVSGSQHHQYSGSSWPGVYMLVGNIQLTSPTWRRFQCLQKSSKILSFASLEGEPGRCPETALVFLDCTSLVSASSPSVLGNCLNLPIETQGRSWRLNKPISCHQEMGSRCPARSCSVSSLQINTHFHIKFFQ